MGYLFLRFFLMEIIKEYWKWKDEERYYENINESCGLGNVF